MISKDFTHTWALANYFATDDNRDEIPNNPHVDCHKVSFSDFIYINMNRNAFTDLSGDSVATW